MFAKLVFHHVKLVRVIHNALLVLMDIISIPLIQVAKFVKHPVRSVKVQEILTANLVILDII